MLILGLFPFFCVVGCALLLLSLKTPDSDAADAPIWIGSRRGAFTAALVAVGVWLVAGTELLGLVRSLHFAGVLVWWSVPLAAMAFVVPRRWARIRPVLFARPAFRGDVLSWVLGVPLVAAVGLTGIIALIAPPNIWDSMTYHMARALYWIQQESVAHFPTNNMRQIVMPPMTEFAHAHLLLLSGDDHLNNLVQWLALLGVLAVASLTVREFGGRAWAQVASALFIVLNPMTFVQASNTKVSVVLTCWCGAMLLGGVAVWRSRRCRWSDVLLIAGALGLVGVTKVTGYLVAVPASCFVGVAIIRACGWKRCVGPAAVIGVLSLAMNAGHITRNMQMFGTPVPSAEATDRERGSFRATSEQHGVDLIASNVIKNIAGHFASGDEVWDGRLERAVLRAHERLGLSVNDPRATMGTNFSIEYTPRSPNQAKSPVHWLLFAAPVLLLVLAPSRVSWSTRWCGVLFALVPAAAFVLFCALVKWSPNHPRHHQVPVNLMIPVAVYALSLTRLRWIMLPMLAAAVWILIPTMLHNQRRPLLGEKSIFLNDREAVRYGGNPRQRAADERIAELVGVLQPDVVGLWLGADAWEYPLVRLLRRGSENRVYITKTNPYPITEPAPGSRNAQRADLIVTSHYLETIEHDGVGYLPIATNIFAYSIFVREDLFNEALEKIGPMLTDGEIASEVAFGGWMGARELGSIEGPYPHLDLPRIRWGLGPRTLMRFYPTGDTFVIDFDARPLIANTWLTIELNGETIRRELFTSNQEFRRVRLRLPVNAGERNTIELHYSQNAETGRPLAMLYRRLMFTYAPREAEAPAPPSAPPASADD